MSAATCNEGLCEVAECEPGFWDDTAFPYPDCNFSVKQVVAGHEHTCALLSNDIIQCFGRNDNKQLGRITGAEAPTFIPGAVADLTLPDGVTVHSVTAGGAHTCALLSNSTVLCWGANNLDQLGRDVDPGSYSVVPSAVNGLSASGEITIQSIAAGFNHTCALLSNNTIECWGDNSLGQLGHNTGAEISTPVPGAVDGFTFSEGVTMRSISTRDEHTCVLLSNSTIQCWGANDVGQLGLATGAATFTASPGAVNGLSLSSGVTVKCIATGSAHTCAVLSDSSIQCWGAKEFGRLGRYTGEEETPLSPGEVTGLPPSNTTTIQSIAVGKNHTCAQLSSSSIQCWGSNSFQTLGRSLPGMETSSASPAPLDKLILPNGVALQSIAAGGYHNCLLLSNGIVKCWGKNNYGQLGMDTTTTKFPVTVDGLF